jgi:phosphate ABC transporter phosphate-binding protein
MRRLIIALLSVSAFAALATIGCESSSSSNATNNKSSNAAAAKNLSGGGATFPDPLIQEWAHAYKAAKGVDVDYQAKGSGFGIQQMTKQTIEFGCSDAPMKKAQLEEAEKQGGDVIHIPITMGPVVPAYNLPGVDKSKPLTFSGQVLAEIYLGKIKKWNDKAIADLNPGVNLPDTDIAPVYRAEDSGTTNIFKEFLAKSSPEFKSQVGVSVSATWPKGVGTGERGNPGIAGRVKNSAGAIGYVELSYAKSTDLAYGMVKNRAGKAILGSPESVTAAAEKAMDVKQETEPYSLHELTFSLTDADGEGSYPISGVSYCVFYRRQKADVGNALKDFLTWAVHDGQAMAPKLHYAPLPASLVKKIEARLDQMVIE